MFNNSLVLHRWRVIAQKILKQNFKHTHPTLIQIAKNKITKN